MIPVVLDASVVMAGCGWSSEPYLCLTAVARRRLRSFATDDILEEWRETLSAMTAERVKFKRTPWPTLDWLIDNTRLVAPAPLGKQRSRDAEDDPYLACALSAQAEFIITRDPDLLVLEKPFGVEIITPRALLNRITRTRH